MEWKEDYEEGIITLQGNYQKAIWQDNQEKEPKKINRGIFDLNRIPTIKDIL